jgi:hypothetical protein
MKDFPMKTSTEHDAAIYHLAEIIVDLVIEHCTQGDHLSSKARPANAAAMRELNKRGIVLFVREGGAEILGLWRKDEPLL